MKASGIFKLSTLALLTTAAMGAQAGISADTAQGTFAVSGDVELDNTYQATTISNADKKNFAQSGRVLVGFAGMRQVGDNNYVKANAQLLMDMDGAPGNDDAWIAMGAENDWEVKLGHFEAYNLFPTGQDTVLNHAKAAGGADFSVYNTGYARGRNSNGEISLSKTAGSSYFEVSVTPKTNGGDEQNAIFVRPVLSVGLGDAFRLAAGAEVNATTANSNDASNDFVGYGATLNYSADMLSVNVNYAYKDQDTNNEKDTSIAVNAQYGNAFIGYVNSVNDVAGNDDPEVNTYYASYKFANIMDVEDLALYLGASTSKEKVSDNKDTSVKLRVKYVF